MATVQTGIVSLGKYAGMCALSRVSAEEPEHATHLNKPIGIYSLTALTVHILC